MKEVMMYEKTETMVESISSDVVTFGFLLLCMWFSYDQGGGWWTFFTTSMFLVSLAVKMPGRGPARWVKLTSKKEAIEWAESLPDDEAPNEKSEPICAGLMAQVGSTGGLAGSADHEERT